MTHRLTTAINLYAQKSQVIEISHKTCSILKKTRFRWILFGCPLTAFCSDPKVGKTREMTVRNPRNRPPSFDALYKALPHRHAHSRVVRPPRICLGPISLRPGGAVVVLRAPPRASCAGLGKHHLPGLGRTVSASMGRDRSLRDRPFALYLFAMRSRSCGARAPASFLML